MQVIEGGNQADVGRQQHPVAEHVPAHVPDTDHGEFLVLDVLAEFAEIPLDGFPGTPCGNPHLLVVVTVGTAGSEGVPEPEPVIDRDAVGDIREGGGSLVRRDHQVGVVTVPANHVLRRHNGAIDQVICQIQQSADEIPVTGDHLGLDLFTVSGGGQLLGDESTLGAHRHDDRVLYPLRLDQAENLGAEILGPLGPPEASPSHLAAPEMHALDPRGVQENLEHWRRFRNSGYGSRIELEGDIGPVRASRGLEIAGAQRGPNHVEQGADDAFFIQGLHGIELFDDPLADTLERALLALGFEQNEEQVADFPDKVRVVHQRLDDVVLAVAQLDLPQVAEIGTERADQPPVKARGKNQLVEAVIFRLSVPDGGKRGFEQTRGGTRKRQAVLVHDFEILDPEYRPVGIPDPVGVFSQYPDTHAFQDGQCIGQRYRVATGIDLEVCRGRDVFGYQEFLVDGRACLG